MSFSQLDEEVLIQIAEVFSFTIHRGAASFNEDL